MEIEKLKELKGSSLTLSEYLLNKISHDLNVIKWILLIPIIMSILGFIIFLIIKLIIIFN